MTSKRIKLMMLKVLLAWYSFQFMVTKFKSKGDKKDDK